MAIPDALLDTSWNIQYLPNAGDTNTSARILSQILSQQQYDSQKVLRQLQVWTDNFHRFLETTASGLKDELNDEAEKTGQLRECLIERLTFDGSSNLVGMAIQARYHKSSYTAVLLGQRRHQQPRNQVSSFPVSALLYKATQTHIKRVRIWLETQFGLPIAMPLQLPPQVLLPMVSEYLTSTGDNVQIHDALCQAILNQAVGVLKIGITFSGATGEDSNIAPQLKTMDFDIPAETVAVLLDKARNHRATDGMDGHTFLDELQKALHERTGLRLPLATCTRKSTTQEGPMVSSSEGRSEPDVEPPLKVTKISCAGFALHIDGRLKLANKPIQDAEVIGYDGNLVEQAYMGILRSIVLEAERRAQDND